MYLHRDRETFKDMVEQASDSIGRTQEKYWIIHLFSLLFTISISVSILPCGMINVHGLFGETITSTAAEDEEQEIVNVKSIRHENLQTAKGTNILNVWFEILIAIIWISFCANLIRLPRRDTLVISKVRMDN